MNLVFRAAWFDAWWPETDTEHAIIVEDDLVGDIAMCELCTISAQCVNCNMLSLSPGPHQFDDHQLTGACSPLVLLAEKGLALLQTKVRAFILNIVMV